MTITQWDNYLADEAFAIGKEPHVVALGDGSRMILTDWVENPWQGECQILDTPELVQFLQAYDDDLGATNFMMIEYNPDEYEAWLARCTAAEFIFPTPPSYHEQDVPDFIGEELWKEHQR